MHANSHTLVCCHLSKYNKLVWWILKMSTTIKSQEGFGSKWYRNRWIAHVVQKIVDAKEKEESITMNLSQFCIPPKKKRFIEFWLRNDFAQIKRRIWYDTLPHERLFVSWTLTANRSVYSTIWEAARERYVRLGLPQMNSQFHSVLFSTSYGEVVYCM